MQILTFHLPSCQDDHIFDNRLVSINEYLYYFISLSMTRNADGGILGARCLVYMETYVLVDFIDSIDGVGQHHFIIFSKISSSGRGGHVTRLLVNRMF